MQLLIVRKTSQINTLNLHVMKQRSGENISEYIIRIYRSEDLIRAFDFDLEKIGNHVINHLPLSNLEKLSEVNFYEEMIDKMKGQNLQISGHLDETHQLVDTLEQLSKSLLKSDEVYTKLYSDALPLIKKNIKISAGKITSEVQICLNGIYGFLLLRLNGKSLNEEDQNMVEKFGEVLSYLSAKYESSVASN